MSRSPHGARRVLALPVLVAAAGLVTFTTWLGPQLAGWVHTGRWAPIGFWQAQGALVRELAGEQRPTASYPLRLRRQLPSPPEFWTVQGLLVICELSLIVGAVRTADIRASRPVSDRRWWRLEGARPRAFARSHTIGELLVGGPNPDRIVIGRYGHPARLLAVQDNIQTLVVAAPRSGKTSGVIIPALLEHQGPTVNTSVRTDVPKNTITRRRALGRV
jgi:type IV secretion system protein VirD4